MSRKRDRKIDVEYKNYDYMTVQQVADYLKLSHLTIRRYVREGILPHYKINRLILLKKSEIDEWLAQTCKVV